MYAPDEFRFPDGGLRGEGPAIVPSDARRLSDRRQ